MSFETLKEEELREAAAMFAVDLDSCLTPAGKVSKKLALAAFAEEGVTWDVYEAEKARLVAALEEAAEEKRLEEERLANVVKSQVNFDDDEVEPREAGVLVRKARPKRKRPDDDQVLVKMERQNPHYEVAGKIFTREHPFVLMSEDEADQIFMLEEGFRLATGREAAEYYS